MACEDQKCLAQSCKHGAVLALETLRKPSVICHVEEPFHIFLDTRESQVRQRSENKQQY